MILVLSRGTVGRLRGDFATSEAQWKKAPSFLAPELLQLRVFVFGFSQDGDVRVGVFPEREEVVIGGFCFCHVALHGIRSGNLKMRERADGLIDDNSAMVEDSLKLSLGFRAPMCCQISFPAHIDREEIVDVVVWGGFPNLDGDGIQRPR